MKIELTPKAKSQVSDKSKTVRRYESPKIECLGKLSALIQGGTGARRDFPPSISNPTRA